MSRQLLWHGSDRRLVQFDGDALKGHVHLGSLDQAIMRSAGKHIHLVSMPEGKTKRVRDTGDINIKAIESARAQGYDLLVYLNRFEGIHAATLCRVLEEHPKLDFEKISDKSFRKLFPEASESYISLDPHDCQIVDYFETAELARRSIGLNEADDPFKDQEQPGETGADHQVSPHPSSGGV